MQKKGIDEFERKAAQLLQGAGLQVGWERAVGREPLEEIRCNRSVGGEPLDEIRQKRGLQNEPADTLSFEESR